MGERNLLRRADDPGVPEEWDAGDRLDPGSVAVGGRGGLRARGKVTGVHNQRSLRVSDGGCGVW